MAISQLANHLQIEEDIQAQESIKDVNHNTTTIDMVQSGKPRASSIA